MEKRSRGRRPEKIASPHRALAMLRNKHVEMPARKRDNLPANSELAPVSLDTILSNETEKE